MSTTANSGDDVDASDLEELVAALREQNEQLIERVEALEERQGGDDKGGGGRGRPTISRREAMVGGGLLGLLGLGATPTLAQDVSLRDNCRWFADNDADGHGLYNLGLLHGSVTGGKELLDLEGTGLEIDANGQLTATGGGGGGGGTPGGSDTQLQYNDGGAFGGIPGLTYDDVAGELSAVPAIADHLVPDADATRDLGAAGTRWRNIYGETVNTDGIVIHRTAKTISSGAISVDASDGYIQVEGEGDAADDLDFITGGVTGQIITIRRASANAITVRDDQREDGRIRLNGSADFTLENTSDRLVLQYDDDVGEVWTEIGRGDT